MFKFNLNYFKIIALTLSPLDYCKGLYGMYKDRNYARSINVKDY